MKKLIKKIDYFVFKLKQNYINKNSLCNNYACSFIGLTRYCRCRNIKTPYNKLYLFTNYLVKLSSTQFIKLYNEIYDDELSIIENLKELKYLLESNIYNVNKLHSYWRQLENNRIQANNEYLDSRNN